MVPSLRTNDAVHQQTIKALEVDHSMPGGRIEATGSGDAQRALNLGDRRSGRALGKQRRGGCGRRGRGE
jgi:hypothetical protein